MEIDFIDYYSDGYMVAISKLRYGVFDLNGNIIIPFEYNWIDICHDGLFIAIKDGKRGFIDINNRCVTETFYSQFSSFSEGLASVSSDNLLYGYINNKGKTIIPFKYKKAGDFKGGLACVEIENDKRVLINKRGDVVSEYPDGYSKSFAEYGLSKVLGDNNLWGVVNTEGKLIVDYTCEYGSIHITEKYIVCILPSDESLVVMDKIGNKLELTPEIESDLEGILRGRVVTRERNQCEMKDKKENEILSDKYNSINSLFHEHEPLRIVQKDWKYGLLKVSTDTLIVPIENLEIENLCENRFFVRKTESEASIIDGDNNEVFRLHLSDIFNIDYPSFLTNIEERM